MVVMAAWTPQGGRAGMGLLWDLLYNAKMYSHIMLLPCEYLIWYGLQGHLCVKIYLLTVFQMPCIADLRKYLRQHEFCP